jgi:type I restriction enzyme R subunit
VHCELDVVNDSFLCAEQLREPAEDGADEAERFRSSRAIDSSISLRNKRDLILAFVDRVSVDSDVKEDWHRYVEARRDEELDHLISDEGLDPDATRAFIERAFRNGAIPTAGAAVTAILPPTSRFGESDLYGIKKQTVLDRLAAFFERYYTLG